MIAVDLVCDIFSPSGYSAHAREMINALVLDKDIDLKLTESKHDSQIATIPKDFADTYNFLKAKRIKPDFVIQFETPEFFEPRPSCFNIGFTQWETDYIPDTDYKGDARLNWVKQMNKMTAMMSSSSSACEAFKNSGVEVYCHYVPGPINVADYDMDLLQELPILGVSVDKNGMIPREKRPPVFGCIAQWNARKNIEDFLVTVLSYFSKGECTILLKTYGGNMSQENNDSCLASIQKIKDIIKNPNPPDIAVITENLSDTDMKRLFKSMDFYVNPSRGEGFCMPLAQAMAAGVTPISTNITAPVDYIEHGVTGLLVDVALEPAIHMPHSPWYRYNQVWGRLNMQDLSEAMTLCISKEFTVSKAKLKAAAEKHFGRSAFMQAFKRTLNSYSGAYDACKT